MCTFCVSAYLALCAVYRGEVTKLPWGMCVIVCVCGRGVNIGVLFRVKSLILARRGEGEAGIEGEKNLKKEVDLN